MPIEEVAFLWGQLRTEMYLPALEFHTIRYVYLFHMTTKRNQICCSFADALQETLGFDWVLLFIQAHLHNNTVVRATRILVTMLSSTPALNRFREGLGSGNWLDGTEIMLNKTTYVVAGMRVIYICFLLAMLKLRVRLNLNKQCVAKNDENDETRLLFMLYVAVIFNRFFFFALLISS